MEISIQTLNNSEARKFLALLQLYFPWLDKDDEEISGSVVISELLEIYQSLEDKLSKFEVIDLAVCTDCINIIANGYNGEDEETRARFEKGESRLQKNGGNLVYGGEDLGFTCNGCDCCGDGLAGDKFKAALLMPKTK